MRADRLVAILLLLQRRDSVTAAEVASELEVSERTARRDLEALGMAGIPVYAVRGRSGGFRLAGGGRTDLSGLSADEVRALFLLTGPASAATPAVRSAMRKLLRALPETFRDAAEAATGAVVFDASSWDEPARHRPDPPLLDLVQRAVVEGQQVELGYVDRDGVTSVRLVDPLGMAEKRRTWYLVANTDVGLRTFRIDRVSSVEFTGRAAERPAGFDLEATWRRLLGEVEARRSPLRVTALVEERRLGLVRYLFGTRLSIGARAAEGRVLVELFGRDVPALAGELAGLGGSIEVLDPEELRAALARIGGELLDRYGALEPTVRT